MTKTGALLSSGALAGVVQFRLISEANATAQSEPPFSSWDEVRAQFKLAPHNINMACLGHASHPAVVRE
jgi:hypothetical protein